MDHALESNEDPRHLSELLLHRMTIEARKLILEAGLSRREIARRLGTSVPQLYRLLDPASSTKSINQMISLLHVLGCAVDLKIRRRRKTAQPGVSGGDAVVSGAECLDAPSGRGVARRGVLERGPSRPATAPDTESG